MGLKVLAKKVGISLILSSMLLGSSMSAFASNSVPESSVDENFAKQIVKNIIPGTAYSQIWNSAELKLANKLYNPDDSLLGYYFKVEKNGQDVGYFMVTADKSYEPILEYGDGIYEDLEGVDSNSKVYYLGAGKAVVAKDKKELEDKFNKSKEHILRSLEKSGEKNSEDYKKLEKKTLKSIEKSEKAKERWDKYEKQSATSVQDDSQLIQPLAGTIKTLGVTRLWQRMSGVTYPNSSCGPTTGAMIANYYSSLNYGVKDSSDYGGDAKFINHLYTEMKSGMFGTSMANWTSGMYTHLNHIDPSWTVIGQSANGYFTTYRDYIDHSRPVALRFDFWYTGSVDFTHHFVAGIGYDTSDNTFAVKDPDGGQTNTGTRWYSDIRSIK
jgi:chaperonin cofactor prefoldin